MDLTWDLCVELQQGGETVDSAGSDGDITEAEGCTEGSIQE